MADHGHGHGDAHKKLAPPMNPHAASSPGPIGHRGVIIVLIVCTIIELIGSVIAFIGIFTPGWYRLEYVSYTYSFGLFQCGANAPCKAPYDTEILCWRIFAATTVFALFGLVVLVISASLNLWGIFRYWRSGSVRVITIAGFTVNFGWVGFLAAIICFGGASKLDKPAGPGCNTMDDCPQGAICELNYSWYLVLIAFIITLFPSLISCIMGILMPSERIRKRPVHHHPPTTKNAVAPEPV